MKDHEVHASPAPLLCRNLKTFRSCLTFFGRMRDSHCILDLRKVRFADPPALVLLHHFARESNGLGIYLPEVGPAKDYISDNLRMREAGASVRSPNRYPLRYVASERHMVVELGKWREMLLNSGALGEERARQFSSNMSEVLINSFAHGGQRNVRSIVAGQTFPKKAHSVLAAVDSGQGIPTSLRRSGRYPGERSDEEWILLALQRGVTSKSRETNRGFGLYLLQDMVRKNGGSMILVSGRGVVSITDGCEPKAEALGRSYPGFRGTFLILDIRVSS